MGVANLCILALLLLNHSAAPARCPCTLAASWTLSGSCQRRLGVFPHRLWSRGGNVNLVTDFCLFFPPFSISHTISIFSSTENSVCLIDILNSIGKYKDSSFQVQVFFKHIGKYKACLMKRPKRRSSEMCFDVLSHHGLCSCLLYLYCT